jgi:hypothetical protein
MNKLIIFKWASLLLSIGCITFFIVDDIYNDNRHVIAEVTIPEVQTEEMVEVTAQPTPAALSECETTINAYETQIASNNDQISKTIVAKYNECMGISAETRAQIKTVKEKKKT